ncbi:MULTISPECIES: hypothetical protein [Cryobacterium]|uniref:hypothetical protein n=1 Tax=Cryobacterium TaxID=69578 RepID=UPI00106D207F|nr:MULTISPECIES: hypothetical protein [Cryobacterium]TFD42939.1 hypothetical protein E3T33_11385 [Cryobacterium sp. TMT1-2-1]TFD84102.1 hypothetical protein E3T56_10330 [Cryobacterium psychrotolerans]
MSGVSPGHADVPVASRRSFLRVTGIAAAGIAGGAAAPLVTPSDEAFAALLDSRAARTEVSLSTAFERVFKPEAHGAVGDGLADDTAAVVAAFTAAAASARVGVVSTIFHPGAVVVLEGEYNLATLTGAIDVTCNVRGSAAVLIAPRAYGGTVLLVGHPAFGSILQNADIVLPDVVKVGSTSLTPGSVGIRVQNLYNSNLNFGRTAYFETGIHFTGLGNGTVYNRIFIGWVSYAKVAVRLVPDLGGWVNQNTFVGGGIQQSSGFGGGGTRRSEWRHLVMDGLTINSVNGNTFVGTSFEGDVSEYTISLHNALQNLWLGCRFEQGTRGRAASVSGSTVTSVAHGLKVGNVVTFTAAVAPTKMYQLSPYYVVTVHSQDKFSVSRKRGGAAIAFGSSGTSLAYFRPPTIRYDGTGGNCSRNVIQHPQTAFSVLEQIFVAGATDNSVQMGGSTTADVYAADDLPPIRARNSAYAPAVRPLFAAYPAAQNPVENPRGWTAALSDRGLLFAANEEETGTIGNTLGILTYKRPDDPASYEIASVRRSPRLIVVSALSCPARTTKTMTFALVGASVLDHVLVTMLSHVPGLVLSHAYVSVRDTVTVIFANLTSAPIALSTSLNAIVFRRFY